MKLWAICFSHMGEDCCVRLAKACPEYTVTLFAGKAGISLPWVEDLHVWTKQAFTEADGVIFVGACGIAVRLIAPHIKDKQTDPAVIVIDEGGRFAISLLSGHLGGANALAEALAEGIGALPVITTATDSRGLFSVDAWAGQEGVFLTPFALAKDISAAFLAGEPVGFMSDFLHQPLPHGFTQEGIPEIGLSVSLSHTKRPWNQTLSAIPKIVCVGIGCKKGIPPEQLITFTQEILARYAISPHAVQAVATIDRKKEEPAIHALCNVYGWPLLIYSKEELMQANGIFSVSAFVQQQVGVDTVCERAAVLGSKNGRLICKKTKWEGMTLALAVEEWSVRFGK